MRLRALTLIALLASACATAPPRPPTPMPGPVNHTYHSNVSVYDEAGSPVEEATGVLDADVDTGEAPVSASASGWRESFTITYGHAGWDGTLTIKSPNYTTTSRRVHIQDGEMAFADNGPGNFILKSAVDFGGEHGWLRVQGLDFLGEDNRPWKFKGFTSFTLLAQQCAGQDISPVVDDWVAHGGRVLRTLGMFKGSLGNFTLAATDQARFDQCTYGYIRYMAARLVRVEFVVFADAQEVMPDGAKQRAWFAHVQTLIGSEWNVLGELCNECEKNGVNPAEFARPTGTRVLWSRGSGLGGGDPAAPPWDYSTYHEARDFEYVRKDECRPYMDAGDSPVKGVPCVSDEPIGASEVDQPGKRAGASNDGGARAIRDFGQIGAQMALHGPGGTFHCDACLVGGLLGPVQGQMATAFFKGINFPPVDAPRWPYLRGANCGDCEGVGGQMPLQQLDQFELRIFSRCSGNECWSVDIPAGDRTRDLRAPVSRAGYHIVDIPFPGLIHQSR